MNNSSANIKLSQFYKIEQSGGFLCRLLWTLLKTVLKPLVINILTPLGLTAAASSTDAAVYTNIFGSGMTTLIISKEEMDDIMKITKFHEESGLLIKGICETFKIEPKEQKGGFFGMLLSTLGAPLLDNLLIGRQVQSRLRHD